MLTWVAIAAPAKSDNREKQPIAIAVLSFHYNRLPVNIQIMERIQGKTGDAIYIG
jgi:hypothetical protein